MHAGAENWLRPQVAFRVGSNASTGVQRWARRLSNGDRAALLLNRDDNSTLATLHLADFLGAPPSTAVQVRDLQARRDLGVICHNLSLELQPHESAFLRLAHTDAPCV